MILSRGPVANLVSSLATEIVQGLLELAALAKLAGLALGDTEELGCFGVGNLRTGDRMLLDLALVGECLLHSHGSGDEGPQPTGTSVGADLAGLTSRSFPGVYPGTSILGQPAVVVDKPPLITAFHVGSFPRQRVVSVQIK